MLQHSHYYLSLFLVVFFFVCVCVQTSNSLNSHVVLHPQTCGVQLHFQFQVVVAWPRLWELTVDSVYRVLVVWAVALTMPLTVLVRMDLHLVCVITVVITLQFEYSFNSKYMIILTLKPTFWLLAKVLLRLLLRKSARSLLIFSGGDWIIKSIIIIIIIVNIIHRLQ